MKCLSLGSIILLGLLFSCSKKSDPAPTQTFITGWNENLKLTVSGQERYFRVYQPAGIAANAPVVIMLHGGSQSMTEIFDTSAGGTRVWTNVADDEKFLLIAPNGVDGTTNNANGANQSWNDCRPLTSGNPGYSGADDVTFISELIEWTKKSFSVDETRIYATGVSNGGMLCYRLAAELNSKIAAIAPFIANLPDPSECTAPSSAMPMMICVATLDPLMPFLGGNVSISERGTVKSAAETLTFWLSTNGVASTDFIKTDLPDINTTDNSTIVKRVFGSSNPAKEIEFYTVIGGGHCMPSISNPLSAAIQTTIGPQNKDMEGAQVAWVFLKRHKK
ncbi:MAG: alpha/beta hydrolase family esterase [Cyclobacteriaceae bacterium]